MNRLILLNDVSTEMGESGFIVGSKDVAPSALGVEQSIQIAKYAAQKIGKVDMIAASDALRLGKLLHRLRIDCENLSKRQILYSKSLRERDFGVLTGSTFFQDSDLFKHSRICAENGESVRQCRERSVNYVTSLCNKNISLLVVSHPFVCQIMSNVFLGNIHTFLTEFWFKKGSFAIFKFKSGDYGIKWEFLNAFNALEEKDFSLDEIYK